MFTSENVEDYLTGYDEARMGIMHKIENVARSRCVSMLHLTKKVMNLVLISGCINTTTEHAVRQGNENCLTQRSTLLILTMR